MSEFGHFLGRAIELLAMEVVPLAGVLAAIGGTSMALWQVLKELLSYHKKFNHELVLEWASDTTETKEKAREEVQRLEKLAAVGQQARDALYVLKTAQLVGQLQAAGRVALTDPVKHPEVVKFLVGRDSDKLACKFIEDARPEGEREDAAHKDSVGAEAATRGEEQRERDSALRRSQVEHYVQRRFDALQIRADWRWARLNRCVAIAVSILLTWLALCLTAVDAGKLSCGSAAAYGLIAIVAGSVAGFIAPVAKDLVSAIGTLRRR